MKKTITTILAMCAMLCWTACDNKFDQNGDFDGMWQMLKWEDKITGETIADKRNGIYYCVQLKLMKFTKKEAPTNYYLSYFTRTKDSLILGRIVYYPNDSICQPTALKEFGVPANGKFRINAMSNSRMILSSDSAELTFRKY